MAGFRWVFTDPSTAESYTFLVNPNAGGTPQLKKTVTLLPLTAPDGAQVIFEGRQAAPTLDWSGVSLDESQYAAVITWFGRRHQLTLTDDLGRVTSIYLTEFTAKRAPHQHYPWRVTYDVKAIVLSSGLQNLISVADSEFDSGSIGSWVILNGFTTISPSNPPEWSNSGSHALKLVGNALPHNESAGRGLNMARHGAGVTVMPGTTYRVRLRFQIWPVLQPTTSYGIHARIARLYVDWSYVDAGSVVHDIGLVGIASQGATEVVGGVSSGPTNGQSLSGVIASPSMPAGGVTMHGNVQVALVTGASEVVRNGGLVFLTNNDPINFDILYIDSVIFSR